MTAAQLRSGASPASLPEVILTETTGTATDLDDSDWVPHLARGKDLVRMFSPSLRWLYSCSHGVEKILPLLPSSVALVRSDVHAEGLAESVFAALLTHVKRIPDRIELKRQHRWEMLDYGELSGRTMVILGTGAHGRPIARIARAFGMHVVGVSRRGRASSDFDEVVTSDELKSVLPRANYLVAALPKTKLTVGLIGAAELALLPLGAFVVNIGRGEVLVEQDLLAALTRGQIQGAYLDVFVSEPLPPESPLWDAPNTIITPHDAHRSELVADRIVKGFCANLRRYLAGEPLIGVADREAGY